jgi:hypothetical protein
MILGAEMSCQQNRAEARKIEPSTPRWLVHIANTLTFSGEKKLMHILNHHIQFINKKKQKMFTL